MTGWLLDTHALLWMLYGDKRLTAKAARLIRGRDPLYYSTVSFWEIALKRSAKGFDFSIDEDWDTLLPEALRSGGLLAIDLEAPDCRMMETLADHHRDPFDRLMIAQALRRNLGVIGKDSQWDAYGIRRSW
jgi:PIN domain nuclease of toxin-antitoxin system